MQRHISPIAKQRISDFFTQEDGNVGRKNAMTAGTVLSGALLAAMMFVPEIANAGPGDCPENYFWCGDYASGRCCSSGLTCCSVDRGYICVQGACPPP